MEKKVIRHYVFTAAIIDEQLTIINNAKRALEALKNIWEMNATCTGCYEGSKSNTIENDGGNFSIYFEDDDINRLINSCMRWQFYYDKYNKRDGIF